MSRPYSVVFDNVSCTAAQDFFEITVADDKPVEIVGLFLSQTGVADIGDAAEELLPIKISRGFATSGSGGSAPTPAPLRPNDTAAGLTAEVNNTTVASAGTEVILHVDNFNVRAGYQVIFPPEARPTANQGNTLLTVRLTRAPADAITLSGTLIVNELG